jgi:hypothetical protein
MVQGMTVRGMTVPGMTVRGTAVGLSLPEVVVPGVTAWE